MNNKNLERMINKQIENKVKTTEREQITTTIEKVLLEDYKESMKLLHKPMGIGFDCMLRLIYNNDEFFEAFIKELDRF